MIIRTYKSYDNKFVVEASANDCLVSTMLVLTKEEAQKLSNSLSFDIEESERQEEE